MKIIQKKFKTWDSITKKWLKSHTLRDKGLMVLVLKRNPDVETFVAFDNNKPIGWALVDNICYNTPGHAFPMFYTKKIHRGKGIAKALMKKISRKFSNIELDINAECLRKYIVE